MEPISKVLWKLYRGTSRHNEWVLALLEGMWPALLGERLARACHPRALHDARLTVAVTDSDWAEPLRAMQQDLLRRIAEATGDAVRALTIERGPGSGH